MSQVKLWEEIANHSTITAEQLHAQHKTEAGEQSILGLSSFSFIFMSASTVRTLNLLNFRSFHSQRFTNSRWSSLRNF
jgi:hypothetical protein